MFMFTRDLESKINQVLAIDISINDIGCIDWGHFFGEG